MATEIIGGVILKGRKSIGETQNKAEFTLESFVPGIVEPRDGVLHLLRVDRHQVDNLSGRALSLGNGRQSQCLAVDG